jgi:hypothetical protein
MIPEKSHLLFVGGSLLVVGWWLVVGGSLLVSSWWFVGG